jgi:hypothetical protein
MMVSSSLQTSGQKRVINALALPYVTKKLKSPILKFSITNYFRRATQWPNIHYFGGVSLAQFLSGL